MNERQRRDKCEDEDKAGGRGLDDELDEITTMKGAATMKKDGKTSSFCGERNTGVSLISKDSDRLLVFFV